MKSRWFPALLTLALLAISAPMFARDKKADNGQLVDSGSFGVYISGRRVATESFQIRQTPEGSITTSEIKLLDGSKGTQNAELKLAPLGDIVRYDWRETGTEKGEAVLEPSSQFLVQHIKMADKTADQPYLMPSSTAVLDDYFFSHRELLLWRYLGSTCKPAPGQVSCLLPKTEFGVIIPRQRASTMVALEYVGRETINYKGANRELARFNLTSESGNWIFWVDETHKLVRILIPDENTEVLRD